MLKVTQTKPASILEPISLDFLPTMLSAHSAFSPSVNSGTLVLQNVSKFLFYDKVSLKWAEPAEFLTVRILRALQNDHAQCAFPSEVYRMWLS